MPSDESTYISDQLSDATQNAITQHTSARSTQFRTLRGEQERDKIGKATYNKDDEPPLGIASRLELLEDTSDNEDDCDFEESDIVRKL